MVMSLKTFVPAIVHASVVDQYSFFDMFFLTFVARHKLVARWTVTALTPRPQPSSRSQAGSSAQPSSTSGVAFRGRSYRLGG